MDIFSDVQLRKRHICPVMSVLDVDILKCLCLAFYCFLVYNKANF